MRIFSCYVGKEEKKLPLWCEGPCNFILHATFLHSSEVHHVPVSVTFGMLREKPYRLHNCSPLSVLVCCEAGPGACTYTLLSTRKNKSLAQEKNKAQEYFTEGYLVAAGMNPTVPKVGATSGNEYLQLHVTQEIKGLRLKLSGSHIKAKSRKCFFCRLADQAAQVIGTGNCGGQNCRTKNAAFVSRWIQAWEGNKGATVF